MPTSKVGKSCRQHIACDPRIENTVVNIYPTHIQRSLMPCLNLPIPRFSFLIPKVKSYNFPYFYCEIRLTIRGKKKSYVLGALLAKIWLLINSSNPILKVLKKVHFSWVFFLQLSLNTEK